MKEGWEYKKLSDVCEILNGFAFKSSRYVSEGIRVIRISNVQKGRVEDNDPKFYPLSSKSEIERYLLREGDLLISLTGNVGRVGRLPQELLPAALNQRVACLRLKGKVINKQYLYHFLNSDFFEIKCAKNSSGVAQLNLSTVWLSNYKIAIPPLSEQQSIVDYLDSAFAKIDAMKANAEKALNEAKALFQASLKEMLEPKEGWEEKTLDDVCEIKSILVDPKEVQYKNLLHVGGANIVSETGELIDLKTAAEEELSSGKFTFNDKDVLYNKIRPYLIKVSRPVFSGLCSADMYPLTSKKGMTRDYLYYILVSRDFTDYAIMNSARAGMPKLNRQTLFAYKCMIPPLSEQQSIVTTLDSLKSKVDRLQANYNKISQECDALKQAILRQVFE